MEAITTCARCRKQFENIRPDEEIAREALMLFPGERCSVVCEECFKEAMKHYEAFVRRRRLGLA